MKFTSLLAITPCLVAYCMGDDFSWIAIFSRGTLQDSQNLIKYKTGIVKPNQKNCGMSPIYNRFVKQSRGNIHAQDSFNDSAVSYVVGGNETIPPGKWPWMVHIQLLKDWFCGGILISQDWVMTAAHCVPSFLDMYKARWQVKVGIHNTSVVTKVVQMSQVKEIHRLTDSMKTGTDPLIGDIALLKLTRPISTRGEYARPLCLLESGKYRHKKNLMRKLCVVTGWGKVNNSKGSKSDVLREVYVDVLSDKKCDNYQRYDSVSQICAGKEEGGKDACRQDSGGPLACLIGRRWRLVGVVSSGRVDKDRNDMCGYPDYPGIYTNAMHKPYQKWIKDVIRGKKPKMIENSRPPYSSSDQEKDNSSSLLDTEDL